MKKISYSVVYYTHKLMCIQSFTREFITALRRNVDETVQFHQPMDPQKESH